MRIYHTSVFVRDQAHALYFRTRVLGVGFSHAPTDVPGARLAVLDDTCGNHLKLVQIDEPGEADG